MDCMTLRIRNWWWYMYSFWVAVPCQLFDDNTICPVSVSFCWLCVLPSYLKCPSHVKGMSDWWSSKTKVKWCWRTSSARRRHSCLCENEEKVHINLCGEVLSHSKGIRTSVSSSKSVCNWAVLHCAQLRRQHALFLDFCGWILKTFAPINPDSELAVF